DGIHMDLAAVAMAHPMLSARVYGHASLALARRKPPLEQLSRISRQPPEERGQPRARGASRERAGEARPIRVARPRRSGLPHGAKVAGDFSASLSDSLRSL